jgi:hypothetical protein
MRKTITLINGSLGGRQGNTRAVLTPLLSFLEAHAQIVELNLATALPSIQELAPLFANRDGFIVATGTFAGVCHTTDEWHGVFAGDDASGAACVFPRGARPGRFLAAGRSQVHRSQPARSGIGGAWAAFYNRFKVQG